MSAIVLLLFAIAAFLVAYLTYGAYLAKKLGLDPSRPTPAHRMKDGTDYIPAKAPVLLGHHFASIAGAGPIIGPVTAAVFGWVPVALWIIVGTIFIGAVHDFSSLVASIRHKGRSIGEIIKENVGNNGKILFCIFTWLTLILILAVFAIVIANTFVAVPEAGSASVFFLIIAVAFGFSVYRSNLPLLASSVIGVAFLFVAIWLGMMFPLKLSFTVWIWVLFVYAAIAAVAPVWILLQPRDYLNSFLLYGMMAGAIIGILIANPTIQMPAFTGFKTNLGYLFPILFVTVACGAISGFHSLVSSGTTSKQLDKETDAKLIGFGGMLIESVLAIVALITAAILLQADYGAALKAGGPAALFSKSVGGFLVKLGIPLKVGISFAALVVSAFALTTLDTATRLARFIFQELFTVKKQAAGESSAGNSIFTNMYFATAVTCILAALLAFSGKWKLIWPMFGAANQLLAALALLAVAAWLARQGIGNKFALLPMIFMFVVTLSALAVLFQKTLAGQQYFLMLVPGLLFVLALVLIYQSYSAVKDASSAPKSASAD